MMWNTNHLFNFFEKTCNLLPQTKGKHKRKVAKEATGPTTQSIRTTKKLSYRRLQEANKQKTKLTTEKLSLAFTISNISFCIK